MRESPENAQKEKKKKNFLHRPNHNPPVNKAQLEPTKMFFIVFPHLTFYFFFFFLSKFQGLKKYISHLMQQEHTRHTHGTLQKNFSTLPLFFLSSHPLPQLKPHPSQHAFPHTRTFPLPSPNKHHPRTLIQSNFHSPSPFPY